MENIPQNDCFLFVCFRHDSQKKNEQLSEEVQKNQEDRRKEKHQEARQKE